MVRTTREIQIQAKDIDEILYNATCYLRSEGFKEMLPGDPQAWAKGNGYLGNRLCLEMVFTPQSVLVQAWADNFIMDESKLDSFGCILPGKKLKEVYDGLCNRILSLNGGPDPYGPNGRGAYANGASSQYGAGEILCPNCHQPIAQGAKFCSRCGYRLG